MKNRNRNIIVGLALTVVMVMTGGCNAWLDIYPENQQTSDNFWKSKEEVQEVLMGAYSCLRTGCYEKILQWGEIRGDIVKLGEGKTTNEEKIKSLEIMEDNAVCKWEDFYKVIARANSIIKYSESVLDEDITYTQKQSDANVAEAVWLRSLCYFYLVRTFGEVPLVLNAYVDDSEAYEIPKSSEETILNQLISDLTTYAVHCKYAYDKDWELRGRATRWAYYALLADVYLWKGEYQNAYETCNKILEPEGGACQFELLQSETWYDLFYPGNSEESIFELQWDNQYNQTNNLYTWFFNGTEKNRYVISATGLALFESDANAADVRGANASYLIESSYDGKFWKYAGTGRYGDGGGLRGSTQRDANLIIYRLADIYLIKAEALAMMGQYQDMLDVLNVFRAHRGYVENSLTTLPSTPREALLMVIDERSREFIAEGKRWFDILRTAKRDDYAYKDYVTEALLSGVAAKDYQIWKSRLSDENSYYLPVYKTEVENSNGVIKQNPYYED